MSNWLTVNADSAARAAALTTQWGELPSLVHRPRRLQCRIKGVGVGEKAPAKRKPDVETPTKLACTCPWRSSRATIYTPGTLPHAGCLRKPPQAGRPAGKAWRREAALRIGLHVVERIQGDEHNPITLVYLPACHATFET